MNLFWRTNDESVPAVEPDDLKSAWSLHQELTGLRPCDSKADLYASVLKPDTDVDSVVYRMTILADFIKEEPGIQGKLPKNIFKVFAAVPIRGVFNNPVKFLGLSREDLMMLIEYQW